MRTHAVSASANRFTAIDDPCSLRHQRERPHSAAARNLVPDETCNDAAAESGENRHVLDAFVRIRDRRRIDARAGLELPERLTRNLVERHELTTRPAGEEQS